MRLSLTYLLTGLAITAAGVALLSPPAALIVTGVAVAGYGLLRDGGSR